MAIQRQVLAAAADGEVSRRVWEVFEPALPQKITTAPKAFAKERESSFLLLWVCGSILNKETLVMIVVIVIAASLLPLQWGLLAKGSKGRAGWVREGPPAPLGRQALWQERGHEPPLQGERLGWARLPLNALARLAGWLAAAVTEAGGSSGPAQPPCSPLLGGWMTSLDLDVQFATNSCSALCSILLNQSLPCIFQFENLPRLPHSADTMLSFAAIIKKLSE